MNVKIRITNFKELEEAVKTLGESLKTIEEWEPEIEVQKGLYADEELEENTER